MARPRRAPCPRVRTVFLAVALAALAGCGPGLPQVYPVKGTVVYKGKGPAKDLAGYSVQFQSVADPAEMPGGPIEADGTFTLFTRVGGRVVPGVKEGAYRACLLQPAVEGGAPPPLVFPKRYTALDKANLAFTVAPGPNDVTIELDRDGR